MAFPRKYQKVPQAVRDGDDDVQLTTLRKRVETAADDVQLAQSDDADADSKQSMSVEKRYAVISAACQQIIRHKRLPVVLRRAQLCVNGYRNKINAQMQPFTLDSLSDLSSTLLNDEESISLLDYIVRQVYVEDLPDDPYATSPSAPSMLSGMPALTLAASTTFPPLTSPPHPLHLPTYNLLSSTLTHLHTTTTTTSPSSSTTAASAASPAVSAIASQRVLRGLRQFVADWKYSERKLGLKEVGGEQAEEEDGEEVEEVEGMGDWLADAEDGEEGEVETMSMADFLGAPEDEAVREAEEEDEDEDEAQGGRTEHRIDVRREAAAEKKDHGATVLRSQEAKLADDDLGDDEDDAEDELDEVRLDDLGLDENDDENDGIGLDLHSSPTRATR